MNKSTKLALIGGGAAAAALGAVSIASLTVPHSIVNIALDRAIYINPSIKSKRWISGCKQMAKIDRICSENAYRLEDGNCRTVTIRARDGERLVGHLHLTKNAKRTVIAMHGWRTSWSRDFGTVSSFFHKNRCNVLYAEQRGHTNSGGSYMGFGLIERYDCADWIDFINRQKRLSCLPIYLCGVSMGASTVLMATGLDLPKNVAGVIADCGFTSPAAEWEHVVRKNLHMPYSRHQASTVKRLCEKKIKNAPDGYSTVKALKSCKVPVLFVHGTADRFVPIDMTYENYAACASDKRLFIVHGAEHGMSYFNDRKGYEREVLKFFDDYDRIKR